MRLPSATRLPAALSCLRLQLLCPPETHAPSPDPRSRPLPFVSSPFAHAVAAIHVFPLLAVKPLRRPSRPQLLRIADCLVDAVLILPFPPPFLAGTAGWRHLAAPWRRRAPLLSQFA